MLAFTTGTITQPDAGSVGLATAEQIRDDLVTHAAWELVEEFTPGGGAVRWYVFKCLATESGLSADYFVVMGRTLASGELRFAICEGYNSGTHTMQYFAHGPTTSAIAYDASGRSSATYVLSTVALPGGTNQPVYLNWIPTSTSTKWWLIVADDAFTVAFNGAANGFVHVGAYEPLTPLTIDLPIQIMGYSSQNGGITRNPAVASTSAYGYALVTEAGGSTPFPAYGAVLGFRGDLRTLDKLQANTVPVAEQGINMITGFPSDALSVFGWALGKQKRMRLGGPNTPAGFAFGDAYTLDGTLWVPFKPDDPRIWDTGVAV